MLMRLWTGTTISARDNGELGELYVHPKVLAKRRKAAKAASKARKKNR